MKFLTVTEALPAAIIRAVSMPRVVGPLESRVCNRRGGGHLCSLYFSHMLLLKYTLHSYKSHYSVDFYLGFVFSIIYVGMRSIVRLNCWYISHLAFRDGNEIHI